MEITSKDIARFRFDLRTEIASILFDLDWEQKDVAELYGKHVQGEPFSKGRISQLVNCRKGDEDNSEALLKWLREQKEKVPAVAH